MYPMDQKRSEDLRIQRTHRLLLSALVDLLSEKSFSDLRVKDICDICGDKLVIRSDDQPDVVRHRLETYHEQTEPLFGFYRQRGKLAVIDSDTIEGTTAAILKALEA